MLRKRYFDSRRLETRQESIIAETLSTTILQSSPNHERGCSTSASKDDSAGARKYIDDKDDMSVTPRRSVDCLRRLPAPAPVNITTAERIPPSLVTLHASSRGWRLALNRRGGRNVS